MKKLFSKEILYSIALLAIDPKYYPPKDLGLPGNQGSEISGSISGIITNIFFPIVGIIAVLFIIIGGFEYITSGVNEEKAEQGKKTLTNSIIGLVIIILAYVIVNVVINTVTKTN